MRLVAVLIVWLIALAALAASNAQHKQINAGLPLVSSAAADCPRLANPCDSVDCNALDTQEIA
jgi:hypothetical protein